MHRLGRSCLGEHLVRPDDPRIAETPSDAGPSLHVLLVDTETQRFESPR
jgi:hypothetical protein